MKRNILAIALLGSMAVGAQIRTNLRVAQEGISGQTAFLDAASTPNWNNSNNIGKGLVFPRTNLTTLESMIATPNGLPSVHPNRLDGMVVYNTATGTSKIGNVEVRPGFYYYENKTTNINGGTWKPLGGDISTAVSSNIYTADGTITSDRTVNQAGKWLDFNNGGIRIKGNESLFNPLVVNAMNAQGGGIAVHPNNMDNRIEFATTTNGDMRFYQNGSGDVIFVKKTTNIGGLVGINNTNPKVRLDVIGGGRFKRNGSNSTIQIDTENGYWGYLDFRRNDVKRWDIGMSNGEETGENAGSNFYISSFKDDGSFFRNTLTIKRENGNTGIGTDIPEAKLDVAGEIIARGQGQTDAYFGGDNTPISGRVMNDVEIGSIKAGVEDVSLYNRKDAKMMSLYANALNAQGAIKSNTLAGDGDKIVIANNDGTLTKGVSVSSFATSNIYTADGSTNGDRTVSTANGFLTIKGNAWNPLVVNSQIVPEEANNNARGGLAVHPNDIKKRVEFATTKDGDSRIWLDGDRIFIKRETGNVGIGNVAPSEKLDVSGSIKSSALAGTGSRPVFANEDGVLTTGGSSAIQVGNTDNITCTSANAGTMNYKEVTRGGQQIGVFGFCIRRGNDYVWAYMAGGSNIFGTSANGAAFGDGL